jgi:uncharacterized membrane protein YphA (DoxX/SURF4 family)
MPNVEGDTAMRIPMSQAGTNTEGRRTTGALLWTAQGLLAVLFLFAGSMKLVLPIEELTREMDFPGWFLRFIGVCEVLGALGLIVPGLARIRPALTPLAAAGLAIIMIGATVTTLAIGGGAGALFPFVVGLLLVLVAYGRRHVAPHPQRRSVRRPALQPAG